MKKYIPIIILTIILLGLVNSAQAAEGEGVPTIVQDYPKLPACKGNPEGCKPGQEGFGLPQFIKYIFIFALGIVGVVGFIMIIIAGFLLVTSTGNPQKAADAKDRITSALLGLLLLLGSYVLLNIINPDLLTLGINFPEQENQGQENQGQENGKHVACFCLGWESELIFQKRCYASQDECTSPCVDLCEPAGFVAICNVDNNKCP